MVPGYGPLAEALFSSTAHKGPHGDLLFGYWWRNLGSRGQRQGRALAVFGLSMPNIDLVTVAGRAATIDQGIEAFLAASQDVVQAEVDFYAARSRSGVPAWLQDLPRRLPSRHALASALRAYHDVSIAPHWDRVRAILDSAATGYARKLATEGVHAFLESLHPELRWESPVLTMIRQPHTVMDLAPRGQGLSIVLSVFCRNVVVYIPLDGLSGLVVVVPAVQTPADAQTLWQPGNRTSAGALAALLGPARAAILDAAAGGCTTSELACQAGISPATASYHAGILRDAGLIITRRTGSAVQHTVTPLGIHLLNGGDPGPPSPPSVRVSAMLESG